jgi:hypothetical protein
MYAGGIFCDLYKDFHCENHKILLVNLHFYDNQGRDTNNFRC